MPRNFIPCLLVIVLVGVPGLAAPPDAKTQVARVLDDWHGAAAEADEKRFFGHFAEDAVFLGTDASERWLLDGFRAYAHPHFAAGRGWKYTPSDRHVMTSGDVAWADEKLHSEKYGALRGTAVLILVDGNWKIAHYAMAFTVPNELASEFVALTRK